MKKIIVILFAFVLLTNCEKEESVIPQENAFKYQIKQGKANDFDKLVNVLEKIENPTLQLKSGKKKNDFFIDRSSVLEVSDNDNRYYTIKIYSDIDCDNCFQNLVVANPKSEDPKAEILTYYPDEKYMAEVKTNSKARFSGKMSTKKINFDTIKGDGIFTKNVSCKKFQVLMCSYGNDHTPFGTCFENPQNFYILLVEICVDSGGGGGPADFPDGGDESTGDPGDGSAGGEPGNSNLGSVTSVTPPGNDAFGLGSTLNLSFNQINWLNGKPVLGFSIWKFLDENGNTTENKNLAKDIIEAGEEGTLVSAFPFVKYPDNSNYATEYPKFTEYLKNELPKLADDELIVNALKEYGSLTKEQVKKALKWDSGPTIKLTPLSSIHNILGRYNPLPPEHPHGFEGPNVIELNEYTIDEIELKLQNGDEFNSETLKFFIGIVILHELTHYGDYHFNGNMKNSIPGEEVGIDFVKEVIGVNIDYSNEGLGIIQQYLLKKKD